MTLRTFVWKSREVSHKREMIEAILFTGIGRSFLSHANRIQGEMKFVPLSAPAIRRCLLCSPPIASGVVDASCSDSDRSLYTLTFTSSAAITMSLHFLFVSYTSSMSNAALQYIPLHNGFTRYPNPARSHTTLRRSC